MMEAKKSSASSLQVVNASSLLKMSFCELYEPVAGLITEGLTFLIAPSKAGKSWFALLLATCVAKGEPFLGRPTQQCRVTYLALEDSFRRMQDRLKAIGVSDPDEISNLYIATAADLIGQGLEEQLEMWLNDTTMPQLVVIDVFQRVRGASEHWRNMYSDDYHVVGILKKIADKFRAAIICIHHTNKLRNISDPFDKISGSNGIMGAADTVILLDRERGADTAIVKYQGRDVWGDDILIRFINCRWELVSENALEQEETEQYISNPVTQLFRYLITQYPQGGKWTYDELYTLGLDILEYAPFSSGRDLVSKLKSGLDKELLTRDGILISTGVSMTKNGFNGKGIRLEVRKPLVSFQSILPHDC